MSMFVVLAVLAVLGVPIAFSIGLAAITGILQANIPLVIVAQRMFTQLDSFALLAIPFFILSGYLMERGGLSSKIVNFAACLVGHIRGGLAMVCVVSCMLFGCISGSGQAASAAIGSILIPAMEKKGYRKEFSAAITAVSGPLGVIIPPSMVMVIYAMTANVSIGDMFLAGYLPGILLGLGLMVVCYFCAKIYGYPAEAKASAKDFIKATKESFLAVLMIIIVMGGILGGFFTATEASVVAVLYAFVVGMFVYRGLAWRDLPAILLKSMETSAVVMFCVATTNILAWVMTSQQIPTVITNFLLSLTNSKFLILLFINIILLFLGCIMDSTPAIILSVPILLPVAMNMGVSPLHFGIITCVNLAIGMSTPPVGITLFVSSSLAGLSVSKLVKPLLPFWIVMLVALLLITYIPQISMLLPNLL